MIFVKPFDGSGEYIIQNTALIGLSIEENTVAAVIAEFGEIKFGITATPDKVRDECAQWMKKIQKKNSNLYLDQASIGGVLF